MGNRRPPTRRPRPPSRVQALPRSSSPPPARRAMRRIGAMLRAVIAAVDVGQITTTIATSIAGVAAAVSLFIAGLTLRRTRNSQGASQLYAFITDWDSAAMRGTRHRLAAGLLETPPVFGAEGFEVLNFFETIGYFVNDIRVIPEKACWLAFSDLIATYVEACREWIDEYRRGDPTLYESLTWLESRMLQITAQELRRHARASDQAASARGPRVPPAPPSNLGSGVPAPDQIREFLLAERDELLDDHRPLEATVQAMPPIVVARAPRDGG